MGVLLGVVVVELRCVRCGLLEAEHVDGAAALERSCYRFDPPAPVRARVAARLLGWLAR